MEEVMGFGIRQRWDQSAALPPIFSGMGGQVQNTCSLLCKIWTVFGGSGFSGG